MRVAFLGPAGAPAVAVLRQFGEVIVETSDPVDAGWVQSQKVEFIVSHGFRHIVAPELLSALDGRAVNLHISYLPWNRGADPNLWSFLEDTPAGVSIHWMTPQLDAGDLVGRQRIAFGDDETLATTYTVLQRSVVELLADVWPALRSGSAKAVPQEPGGSYHRLADKNPFMHLLTDGWETRVGNLRGAALS